MPILSMFYGIVIRMYFFDNKQHHEPHIHAEYQGKQAVFAIYSGDILAGSLHPAKTRLVVAWIEIHREELIENWDLAVSGNKPFSIDPLH